MPAERQPKRTNQNRNSERNGRGINPLTALGLALATALGGGALGVALSQNGGENGDVRVVLDGPRGPRTPEITPTTVGVSCPEAAPLTEHQPQHNPDGTLTSRDLVPREDLGFTSLIFDGDLPPTANDVSVMEVFRGRVKEKTYIQGTWWMVCKGTDPLELAQRIAREKASRNPGLPVQVIDNGQVVETVRT